MSEQQIEVKTHTKDAEVILYDMLVRLIHADKKADRVNLVSIASDAFEEYKLQNNSTIL